MSYRVLFLESKEFYQDILDASFFSGSEIEYDGASKYKDIDFYTKYDLVVYTIYSSSLYNLIVYNLKCNNIKTMLLMDGICEFSNFINNKNICNLGLENYHPIIADSIGVVGDMAQLYFNSYGVNAVRYLPPRVLPCRRQYNNGNEMFDFLITTANTAYYDEHEFSVLVNLIKKVIETLDKNNMTYCFRVFDENLIQELEISASTNFKSGDFGTCVSKAKAVITTPSSIVLDSMNMGLPVATLVYRDSPLFIQSGWMLVRDSIKGEVFDSMLVQDSKRMHFQKAQVEGCKSEPQGMKNSIEANSYFSVEEVSNFINKNMQNMLNSKFNINVESFVRNLYRKYIKGKRISKIFR